MTEPDFEVIGYSESDHVAEVTLRGSKMNAYTEGVFHDLPRLADYLNDSIDNDIQVVIFRGEGDVFSTGADISIFEDITSPRELRARNRTLPGFYDDLESLEIPTIAAIDGPCVGGGLELAIACDIRIASKDAKFGFPEAHIGLIPGTGGCSRFVKLVGYGTAKEIILTGDIIGAERAKREGLVNRVVPHDKVTDEVNEVANKILEQGPVATGLAKRVIRGSVDSNLQTGHLLETLTQSLLVQTEDHQEGLDAFKNDRDPDFEGK